MTTKEYIIENLDRTIRHNATDEGNRIGLPYPFTVPSRSFPRVMVVLYSVLSWKREWLPTSVFLTGEFHEQRSLMGYSLWGRKESNTTE